MQITKDTRVSTILEEYGDIADVMEVFGVKRGRRLFIAASGHQSPDRGMGGPHPPSAAGRISGHLGQGDGGEVGEGVREER